MPAIGIARTRRGGGPGSNGATSFGGSSLALRQLWVSLAGRDWASLAVVPTGGLSALPFATALVETAGHCGAHAAIVDASQCDLRATARVLEGLGPLRPEGVRVVAAVDSVLLSLAAMQIALGADAVLLLVPYEDADLDSVRAAMDMVGRDRILGCVAFRGR